ncbi:hypothetical protein H0H92_008745 [Tricholoma furcatifolium]|nr:hypothetical protein H0H92_008745 [Tricholoma furcatifolium]
MTNINYHQATLSEEMLLLRHFSMPHRRPHKKQFRDPATNREVHILNTIVLALSTGKPGDNYAAAFDKHEKFQLVLAKNEPPNLDDIAAATEFISLIQSSKVSTAGNLFPFLIRRCRLNIEKRIHNLHAILQDDTLCEFVEVTLQIYKPSEDIQFEFPDYLLEALFGDSTPPFNTLWTTLVETLTGLAAKGLPQDPSSAVTHMTKLYLYAMTIAQSSFLKLLLRQASNLMNKSLEGKAEKLKRRLGKVYEYATEIQLLLKRARKLPPISHRWVTSNFNGTGEGTFTLCDDPREVVARGRQEPSLSPQVEATLYQILPSIKDDWAMEKTVSTCVHAELRVILDFGPSQRESWDHPLIPIGVSKRSCLGCTLWIEHYNDLYETRWTTSRSYGKPCANWALPGAACSWATDANGDSNVDLRVLTGVRQWLYCSLQRLSPRAIWSRSIRRDDEGFWDLGSDVYSDSE